MPTIAVDLGFALLFIVLGAIAGIVMVLVASVAVPWILGRITPNMDEAGEIARGNRAVAEYFGRVVGAVILGVSIVVAAAVLGGVIAALH